MMYSEFAKAVGCRDNAHNHKVFENLEVMYMNTDMSKEEIYEYGRKLVDNSKSKEQLELEAKVNKQIAELKEQLDWEKERIETLKFYIEIEKDETYIRSWKCAIKSHKEYIRFLRNEINALKWVLEE